MQIRDAQASVCGGYIGEPMRHTARADREMVRAAGFEAFNIVGNSTPIAPRDSQLIDPARQYLMWVPHPCAFFRAQGWETSTLIEGRINNCALAAPSAAPDNRDKHKARWRIPARHARAGRSISQKRLREAAVSRSGARFVALRLTGTFMISGPLQARTAGCKGSE